MDKILASYQSLLTPSDDLIQDLTKLEGDIIILGVGGKMGPDLARKAKQAIDQAGLHKKVIGVARFGEPRLQQELNRGGIETIAADLLIDEQLWALPEVKNVLYLAGTKFGTQGNEGQTWVMNSYLPGRVAQKFKNSSIVAFSTGNVYPMLSEKTGGATEQTRPEPVGEYAQSCLGRERVFLYFAALHKIPLLIYRLNYANDVTYGVLIEIAQSVIGNKPIDLTMGSVNVIWQGDANEIALRCLLHTAVPAKILNVTGPDIISIRWLAEEFGTMTGQTPVFTGEEQPTALLSNATESIHLFGQPKVDLHQMMVMILEWLQHGGKLLNKPTHFSERKGQF